MTGDVAVYLGPLLTDPSRIRREAVRRRKPFDEMSVSADAIPDHEAKGWQVDRKLKRLTKVKREKEVDERLENRFWMLLFKLGYPELSDGRAFTILIERKGAEPLRKQVDVFGKDDETVIVAECKACAKLTRRHWLMRIHGGNSQFEPGNLQWVPKKQRRKRQRLPSAATIISRPAFLRQERVFG
jgi:DNA sulfur modification protein DndB